MNQDEKPLWKRVILIIVLVVGFGMTIQTSVAIYQLYRRRDIVVEKQEELDRLEKQQVELKNQLSRAYSAAFLEQEAREKLGLVKPGETLVIVPSDASDSGTAAGGDSSASDGLLGEERVSSTLEQWWHVFF